MEGIGAALGALFKLVMIGGVLLVTLLIVALVASFVGWHRVMEWWPFGFAGILGFVAGVIFRGWFGE